MEKNYEIEKKVISIFQGILKEEDCNINLKRSEYPNWDSMLHIELIFALEESFDLQFTEEELERINSLASIIKFISSRNK